MIRPPFSFLSTNTYSLISLTLVPILTHFPTNPAKYPAFLRYLCQPPSPSWPDTTRVLEETLVRPFLIVPFPSVLSFTAVSCMHARSFGVFSLPLCMRYLSAPPCSCMHLFSSPAKSRVQVQTRVVSSFTCMLPPMHHTDRFMHSNLYLLP
jgi:hypothetical protein